MQRVASRTLTRQRDRYEQEVADLVAAGMRVLERDGVAGTTVAAVLAESGRSTRAFYRHFRSKDDLLIAVHEAESEAAAARLRARIAAAGDARVALQVWIDDILGLAFAPRRAARARMFQAEGQRIEALRPGATSASVRLQLGPLAEILERGRADGTFPHAQPVDDARSIYSVVYAIVQERVVHGDRATGAAASLDAARAHIQRFVLPVLGGAR